MSIVVGILVWPVVYALKELVHSVGDYPALSGSKEALVMLEKYLAEG